MLEYTGAFVDFAASIRPGGTIFVHESVTAIPDMTAKVHKDVSLLSYGANRFADYHAENIHLGSDGFHIFDVAVNIDGNNVNLAKEMHLSVPGQHNVLNAVAAMGVADVLGIDLQQAAAALTSFTGSGRRFEVVGIAGGVTFIDDYAHHPTEILATLSAARSRYQGHRIWAIWQPHTYSRTRLLRDQFANSFRDADQVIVTEIYASREPVEKYSSAQVAALVPGDKTSHIQSLKGTEDYLYVHLQTGDIVVVLSAGDADQINKNLLVRMSERTN
jgi:UDP-N-acetylmuramate--alanine ligase